MKKRPGLSKSRYAKGVQCPKYLWLAVNRPELASEPNAMAKMRFEQGHEVGALAREYYSGGTLIEEAHTRGVVAAEQTKALIEKGEGYIYEAAFIHDGTLVLVDILRVNEDGSLEILEVKSSTGVRTDGGKIEDKYGPDVAIQKYVVEKCGYKVNGVHMVYVNNQCEFKDALELDEYFIQEEVTKDIKEYVNAVGPKLKAMQEVLDTDKEPQVAPSPHCNNPYECNFKDYCWKDLPKHSVLTLPNVSGKKLAQFADKGIQEIKDIPDNFELTPNQKAYARAVKTATPEIDALSIQSHLKNLEYPLYFLDFETFGTAIPKFKGTRPHVQYPFQFSLHIQAEPKGALTHFEFLHNEDSDPRRLFAEKLLAILGDSGSIVVYYEPFEKSKTKLLSDAFPDLAEQFKPIFDRFWDLHTVFQKRWYVDADFLGSSSIKKVLPVLCPAFSYSSLNIQDGGTAMGKYCEMVKLPAGKERDQIYQNLLEYCKLDTLAMVQILGKLQDLPLPSPSATTKAKDGFLKMKKR